jgi:hypothetical protein
MFELRWMIVLSAIGVAPPGQYEIVQGMPPDYQIRKNDLVTGRGARLRIGQDYPCVDGRHDQIAFE